MIYRTIPTEAYNALFLTRVFTKHFAGNLTNEEIKKQFEGKEKISIVVCVDKLIFV